MTSTDRIFLIYATAVGAVIAGILVWIPASRGTSIPPYFWALTLLALFDGLSYFRGKGAPGTTISPIARIAAFGIALGLLFLLPKAAGVDLPLVLTGAGLTASQG